MSTYQALSCQELVELVTEYLEGTLPAEERERFEAHLDDCGACRTYLDQMRTTIELTGSLTLESIPTQAQAELLRVFRGWHSAER